MESKAIGPCPNSATGKFLHRPMLGNHPAMRILIEQAIAVGRRSCPTIIHGESGTGKELLARQIHLAGSRATGPFVPVDCSTLCDTLIESQLFGHVRGAFTGAACNTLGLLRAADGGTLFLDEIGELPLVAQAKLLRCLQEREVMPVGASRAVPVDVCVVCATHRSVGDMVAQGTFRADLYFRLNVVTLRVPPLRDRRDDIPVLATAFLEEIASRFDEQLRTLSDSALRCLMEYAWPGNVRELRNVLERACAMTKHEALSPKDFPGHLAVEGRGSVEDDVVRPLMEVESRAIALALRVAGGNQSVAALALHVERHRLRRLIGRHGLEALIR
jgi:DNA-binding NtrC family response regulator